MDRRTILGAVGVGVTVGLAGCSGNGNDTEPSAQGTSTDSTETNQTTDSSDTNSETENGDTSGDVVHTGEEEFEEFIGSRSDYLDGYPDYHWIELEEPSNQVEQPIESEWFAENNQFTYFVKEGSFVPAQGEEYEIDTMYITIPEPGAEASSEFTPEIYVLNENLWDEDADFIDNIGESTYGLADNRELDEDDLEVLFSEDIRAYNDVSDNFPQEYLDSI